MSGSLPYRRLLARAFAAVALVAGATGATPLTSSAPAAEAVHALRQTVGAWVFGQEQWVESWAAAAQSSARASRPPTFHDQTLRLIVRQHASGSRVRLRLSNVFGDRALTLGRVRVGVRSDGPTLVDGSNVSVTFGGKTAVTIAAGAARQSDDIPLAVTAGQELAVSLYLSGRTGATTWHRAAAQTSYVSGPGDHTADTAAAAYRNTTGHWFILDAVSAWSAAPGTIVTLGDSITDGVGSTPDTNRRWPDRLAARLRAKPDQPAYTVANAGIAGNRVLTDDARSGPSALNRLDRDVLSRPGIRYVVLLEGINDLGRNSRPGAAYAIIAGYRQIISRAHDRGVRVIGGTLTPVKGSGHYSRAAERQRSIVNAWIRTSGQFDAVIDFDAATRDRTDPERFLPRYDSGDHLHPSDAGYRAMADAVNLAIFKP
jgi:lysophospholipase L1-like esterase